MQRARPSPSGDAPWREGATVLLACACALLACERQTSTVLASEPPLPADLAELDPRVVERIELARRSVLLRPDDADAWGELGMVYAVERLRNLAIACYGQAAARDPAEPRWPYREACMLYATGRLEDAAAAMARSLAIEPGYAPSHWRLGTYRLELGDLAGAEDAFRRATEVGPDFPGGWVGLAKIHLQGDETDRALDSLAPVLASHPADPIATRLLHEAQRSGGVAVGVALQTGDPSEAPAPWPDPWEEELRSLREAPGLLEANRLIQQGKGEEALRVLAEVEASSDRQDFVLHLAEAHLLLGHYAEAEAAVRELLSTAPESAFARVRLARILEQRGALDQAAAELDHALRNQPRYAEAWAAKGRLCFKQKDYPRAFEALKVAVESGDRDPKTAEALGFAALAVQRWKDARAAFESLVASADASGDAWTGLAKARLKLGEFDAAEEALRRAAESGVGHGGFHGEVEKALAKARERRARGELEKVAESRGE